MYPGVKPELFWDEIYICNYVVNNFTVYHSVAKNFSCWRSTLFDFSRGLEVFLKALFGGSLIFHVKMYRNRDLFLIKSTSLPNQSASCLSLEGLESFQTDSEYFSTVLVKQYLRVF